MFVKLYFPCVNSTFELNISGSRHSLIKMNAYFSGHLKSWMIKLIQNDPSKILTYCKTSRIILHFHRGGL
jgi:hypothetical protein